MEFLDLKTTEIISNALQKLNDFTNLTFLSPGSKARLLIDILSEELGAQAEQFDQNIGAGLLRKANGVILDYIGEIYGLSRLTEVKAEVTAEEQNFLLYTLNANFGAINNGANIIIQPGELRFSNDESFGPDSVVYVNTEVITLNNTDTTTFFSAQSLNSGEQANVGSNALVFHDFNNYSDSLNRSLLVTNSNTVSYGRDRERDENYRYRIQKEKISSEAGNETAIRLALLIIPGVADVIRIPYARGIGTCDWLIRSTSINVSSELLEVAQEAIESKQSSGMSNSAKSPVLIGVEFIFALKYKGRLEDRQKDKIKADVKKNIADYVNNLEIAESLILDQVVRVILNSSDLIESMGDEDSSDNFRNIFIYKRSGLSNALIRKTLSTDYTARNYERVILENTIETPITIIDIN